jgi:transcriptional regulator with XRE-family HTH domain
MDRYGAPDWTRLPAAVDASASGRYGVLLRLARTAAGLTLEIAGQRVGYSASTLSRMESGVRPLTDVVVLRRLAEAFAIPPRLFGLADPPGPIVTHAGRATDSLTADGLPTDPLREDGDGRVRRRDVLSSFAGLTAAPLLPATRADGSHPTDPAQQLLARLEQVLLRPAHPPAASIEATGLRTGLAAVRADYQASRYPALTARLPALLAAVADGRADPAVTAGLYNTAVCVCISLKARGLDWLAADRALAAARAVGDPAVGADVARNVASLLRGAERYAAAEQVALDAADRLPFTGPQATAEHLSLYGKLLCNASYSAAAAGDRSRAGELLDDADSIARQLGADRNEHWTAFGPTDVLLHRITAAWRLGDAGTAIHYARTVPPSAIRLPERQGRFWVDVARAYQQWNKPSASYRALLAAEAAAPDEVRAQPKVRAVTNALLQTPTTPALAGLGAFASRLRVA